jgi:hypothetical protein
MAETIVPVVHGERRASYRFTVFVHAGAATAAAGAFGAALAAAGSLLSAPWGAAGAIAVGGVASLYALRELAGLPIPIPDRRRQVPDWWRTFFSAPMAGLLYGLGLGVGFLTFLSFGTFVAVAAGALASGQPLLGAAICAPFGLARGLSVAITRNAQSAEDAIAAIHGVEELAATPLPRRANGLALAAVASAALIAALT